MGAARISPVLVPLPRPRTPPAAGPWQDAPTVIADVRFLLDERASERPDGRATYDVVAKTTVMRDRLATWRAELARFTVKPTPARGKEIREVQTLVEELLANGETREKTVIVQPPAPASTGSALLDELLS